MGAVISLAMSYNLWKEYKTIEEERKFKIRRAKWVQRHRELNELDEVDLVLIKDKK